MNPEYKSKKDGVWYDYKNGYYKWVWVMPHRVSKWHGKGEKEQSAKFKRHENIRRAIRTIEGIAYCNNWDWWLTLTIDRTKWDRGDLSTYYGHFTKWLQDKARREWHSELRYLMVPELHRDLKTWHLHGLVKGIPIEALKPFEKEDKLPKYIRSALNAGRTVYDWPEYRAKYGYVTVEELRSVQGAARYMEKYMAKRLYVSKLDVGKHLYYITKGLERPKKLEEPPEDVVMSKRNGYYEWDYGFAAWYEKKA